MFANVKYCHSEVTEAVYLFITFSREIEDYFLCMQNELHNIC